MTWQCTWDKNGVFIASFVNYLITILGNAYGIKIVVLFAIRPKVMIFISNGQSPKLLGATSVSLNL
jgi:hypothetical protein